MNYFVNETSIVRKIWGNGDTILFVFAGAAAEFALNKAVDWLYFTGKLPADPLGRLFSTVMYAREIVFSEEEKANHAIDRITAIHTSVEKNRGATIPDWAYRDVLYMLIHYSIAAFELLERKVTHEEKQDIYDVFHRMGLRMQLKSLPTTFDDWLISREGHLEADLVYSHYSKDLFRQYRKHLGGIRYWLLRGSQQLVVPSRVNDLLRLGRSGYIRPLLWVYKGSKKIKLEWFLKSIILPRKYQQQIRDLDIVPGTKTS